MTHSLSLRHCARISGSWLSIWNEGGEFWCEAAASRNEPDPQRVDYTLEIAVRSTPTAEPFRSLVEKARRLEREGIPSHSEKILAAMLFVGCAWTDSADTGMSVVLTADRSRSAARGAAIHLAQ